MLLWRKKTNTVDETAPKLDDDEQAAIVSNLYKKNIEIVNKNKTLSLLSKLYEISILTLEPKELAKKVSDMLQQDLNFEIVGIFNFENTSNTLLPLAFSESERIEAALTKAGIILEDLNLTNVKEHKFFKQAVSLKKENLTNNIEEVWTHLIDRKKFQNMKLDDFIKTTLLYPLIVEDEVRGTILLSLNRNYETLNDFEKESIKSFVNVIGLALEKALLYQELQNANNQLRQLDTQKDELLSIVSHQLATPVSAMKWNLEMMLDGDMGKLTKEQEDNVKSLQNISGDLSDLVSMILDVSRVQLGRMKMDKQELDLGEFFKEILEVIQPKVAEKKVKFNISMPDKLPKAMLDKRYTRMTIENLLTNAVKYTPNTGKVDFNVQIKGNTMYCQVKDTGMGIPKAEQDKIFGKMFRASNVRNTVDGNGFGLYVAKGAIEAQGGKIWFESQEGKGTTFFVELPLK
jgi:signal transduction histidine kinase